MSLRWVEGFEVREVNGYFDELYGSVSGSFGGVTGRKHGRAVAMFNDAIRTPALVGSVSNTWFVQFDMRKITGSTGTGEILQVRDGTGEQFNLHIIDSPSFSGNFRIEARRGSTVLETSGDIPWGATARGWFVYVLKVVVRTGVNGSFELRQFDRLGNSSTILNTAGVNTANQGTDGADRVQLQAPNTNLQFDNFLVWDDVNSPAGTVFDDFHTVPFLIYGMETDGDGNQNDWDPSSGGANWVLVNNPPNNDSGVDNDEVTSQAVNDIDLYTMDDVGPSLSDSPTIRGVAVTVRHRMKNSGTRTLQVRVRDVSLSEADQGTAITVSSTSVSSDMRIMEQNPVTTAAWTETEVDGVELGMRVDT